MYQRNIARAEIRTQAEKKIKVVQEKEKDIFCPMCEAWHENNSWCQYTGNEGYSSYAEATEGF